jgi:Rod binding domain-containing protein
MTSAGLSNLNGSNSSGPGVLDQRLSLDVQGVDALRRTVRTSPQEGMKQASKQFEVMFMQMVLKSMRDATPSDGMFSSSQEKTYTSMLDQQLSQNLSGRGLGLAEAMFTQLSRTMGGDAGNLPSSPGLTGDVPAAQRLGGAQCCQCGSTHTGTRPFVLPGGYRTGYAEPQRFAASACGAICLAHVACCRAGEPGKWRAGATDHGAGRAGVRLGKTRNSCRRWQDQLQPVRHQGRQKLEGAGR